MFIPFLKEAFSVYMNQHFVKHHRYCPKYRQPQGFLGAFIVRKSPSARQDDALGLSRLIALGELFDH